MENDNHVELTIGTDPELVILDPSGAPVNVGDYASRTAPFGADGHVFLAELRPGPARTPKLLCENVFNTLCLAGDLGSDDFSWYAGPWIADKPMGGHIHFGARLTPEIRRTLDVFGSFILPFIEPQVQARTRRTTRFRSHTGWVAEQPYGLVGDFRNKPHGFEWRTPSSFIVNPGMTLAMFALSKALVYEELVGGPCSVANLSPKILNQVSVDPEDIHNANRDKLEPFLPVWWKIINNLTYFKKGHEGRSLLSVLQYLRTTVIPKGGFNTRRNLKNVWKVTFNQERNPNRNVLNDVLEVNDLTNVLRVWQDAGAETATPTLEPRQTPDNATRIVFNTNTVATTTNATRSWNDWVGEVVAWYNTQEVGYDT